LHDAFSAVAVPCWARLPSVAAAAIAAVTTATPAASTRTMPALDFIQALLLLTVSVFDATKPSFVVRIGSGRGIPGGMEDAEHAHVRVAGVFQTMHHERRQVDARPRRHRDHVVADVVRALAFDHVDDFVVGVAVRRRLARRNHAYELGHVEAADILVDAIAELAVGRSRERRLLRVADDDAAVIADAAVTLRRGDRDDEQLLRARVLDGVALLGRHECACVRLESMRLALEVERAASGDDEEHFLPAVVGALGGAAGREADDTLLEVLAAAGGVDNRADLRGVARLPAAFDVPLVDDE